MEVVEIKNSDSALDTSPSSVVESVGRKKKLKRDSHEAEKEGNPKKKKKRNVKC